MKTRFAPIPIALLLVVLPAVVQASDNQLGLFYDDAASVDEIEVAPNSVHNLYLVLINPVNTEFDGSSTRDVSYVWGFECAIEAPSGDALLGVAFPTDAINLGTADNIVAGYAAAIAVSAGRTATLATFNVLTAGNNPEGYRLSPASPASHANTMAYVDYEDPDDPIVDMGPVSGSYDRPVFTFGDYTIERHLEWGGVKSLFR
ncbi:hypothetical protein KDM41_03480 [bacterium]|nr:hypothetical protein [bacterium]